MSSERTKIIQNHFTELSEKYNNLELINDSTVKGELVFSAHYKSFPKLEGNFHILIDMSEHYPELAPTAKEIGGRIPKSFHTNPDGKLCLGAKLDINMKFKFTPSLMGFVENILIPFFYSFLHNEQKGYMPFGELAHGPKGILEFYYKYFNVKSEITVLQLLQYPAQKLFWFHQKCPCGSNISIRKCHGSIILNSLNYQSQKFFKDDFYNCLYYVSQKYRNINSYLQNNLDIESLLKVTSKLESSHPKSGLLKD